MPSRGNKDDTEPYSYDGNGNTTVAGPTTQAYNAFNQFTSNVNGGTTTNFTYAGPRNDERLTSGSTSFLNGTLGITQQTIGGATTSFIRDPDGNLISMRTSTGASFYYTTDALGSTILLTDSTQAAAATYSYDSWGQTTATGAQAATNPWQYAGGYKDPATGYTKFGARYYNPTIGRFTQPDPSGQETNRYAYVACNPINATDPTGLDSTACGWSYAALVAGLFLFVAAAPVTGGVSLFAAVQVGIGLGSLAVGAGLTVDACI